MASCFEQVRVHRQSSIVLIMDHLNAEHWRQRAAELRNIAVGLSDKVVRITLQSIANDLDHLANRLEVEAKE